MLTPGRYVGAEEVKDDGIPFAEKTMHRALFGNAEAQRTQSSCSCISSALSASPRFKTSPTEIAEHGYVLTPGRYVGAEEVEDDGVPFAEKMKGLTRELATQFHESEKLQSAIRDNMQKREGKVSVSLPAAFQSI